MGATVYANDIIYSIINVLLLLSIIAVTYRTIIEYKITVQSQTKYQTKNVMLFATGLIFNFAAFFCMFVLFFRAFSKVISASYKTDHQLFFPCNLVFLQNTFLVIVLFTRIYHIFHGTELQLTLSTIIFFVVSFIISSAVFITLLVTKITIPGTDKWFNCAVTLCIFNVFFMFAMTTLFLNKLAKVVQNSTKNLYSNQRKFNMKLIQIITKTTLLSLISMLITFVSCALLLFRFSLFGDNTDVKIYVEIISDWVIALDIYSNFACYSLSFRYYNKYYIKLCKCCDYKCKRLWYFVCFGGNRDMDLLFESIQSQTKLTRVQSNIQTITVASPTADTHINSTETDALSPSNIIEDV
eukprot:208712_1